MKKPFYNLQQRRMLLNCKDTIMAQDMQKELERLKAIREFERRVTEKVLKILMFWKR
jgi:hypothetical protein